MSAALSLFDFDTPPSDAVILRPYQQEAIDTVLRKWDSGINRALITLATGTGKTTIFSELLRRKHLADPSLRSLVVAHREELLEQAKRRIELIGGLRVGIERASERAPHDSQIVVASVQTIGRPSSERLSWLKPGVMILDECHHAAADTYMTAMRNAGVFSGDCKLLGVTATPHRLDNKPLHGTEDAIFQEQVYSYGILPAIRENYLVDVRGYQVHTGKDIGYIKTTAGDFNQGELAAALDDPRRDRLAIDKWKEVASDRSTMVFCASVDHAHKMASLFKAEGISAEAVDGSTHSHLRAGVVERFQNGTTKILCNMAVFTEGFDAPICSCILMMRPTKSWVVFAQAAGRGLRTADGKSDCIIIDMVDNAGRHSLASIPGIVGLPSHLNLNGQSLNKTESKIGSISGAASALRSSGPIDADKLEGFLKRVDWLVCIKIPDEIYSHSSLAWKGYGDACYELSCSNNRCASLECDSLGIYRFSIQEEGKIIIHEETWGNLKDALSHADKALKKRWSDSLVLMDTKAKWRREPISDGQRNLLVKFGVNNILDIDSISKGDASALIDKVMKDKSKK